MNTAQGIQQFVLCGGELFSLQVTEVVGTAVTCDYLLPLSEVQVASPYDPTFLLLSSLSETEFTSAEELLTAAGCSELSSMLHSIEQRLIQVCEVITVPEGSRYKLVLEKLDAWLLRKGKSLVESFSQFPSGDMSTEICAASIMWQYLPKQFLPRFCKLIGIENPDSIMLVKRSHEDAENVSPTDLASAKKRNPGVRKHPEGPKGMTCIDNIYPRTN